MLISLITISAFSQSTVKYTYDPSGNRKTRNVETAAAAAQWLATGTTRCLTNSSSENTGYHQREERDNNASSPTYNQTRWINMGLNTTACPVPPNWVYTGNYRCQLDGVGQNTGYLEEEQVDNNPLSASYNQTQWMQSYYDTWTCPLPCDYYSCEQNGPEFRCVWGYCEIGYKVYTWSWYDGYYYNCTYHYEWSDGYWSPDYYEYNWYGCY